jgi:hypothetical protein
MSVVMLLMMVLVLVGSVEGLLKGGGGGGGGAGHPLFKSAQVAIKEKNCLPEYNGEVTMKHRIVSSCFSGGFIEEVTLHPCKEGACENIKAAAKVTYTCDTSRPRVKCLSGGQK